MPDPQPQPTTPPNPNPYVGALQKLGDFGKMLGIGVPPAPPQGAPAPQQTADPAIQSIMARVSATPTPGQPSAEAVHQQRAKMFLNAALRDYWGGGITRQQLAEAAAAHDAYDYGTWKQQNVVHPMHAASHGVAREEPNR